MSGTTAWKETVAMRVNKAEPSSSKNRMAVSVTVRFALNGKIYPESVAWRGRQYPILKVRKVSYFCGDAYSTPDRVFLVEYKCGTFHLFYIGQRWFVHPSDPSYQDEEPYLSSDSRRNSGWRSRQGRHRSR